MFGLVVKSGARNVRRHARRSLLVGVTAALGAAAIMVNAGVARGVSHQLIENLVVGQMGHLRVTPRPAASGDEGESPGGGDLFVRPEELRAALQPLLPGAQLGLGLSTLGMALGAREGSTRIALWGLEPDREPLLMSSFRDRAIGGLGALEPGTAYISRKLSQRLGATRGEALTLAVPAADGELAAEELTVEGVLERSAPWQDYFVYLPVGDLQRLMGCGDAAQELKIFVDPAPGNLDALRDLVAAAVADRHPELQVQTYWESGSFFLGIVTANRIFLQVMNAVLLVAVALGVANAQLFSVNERRREIGTMLALGTPRNAVRGIFLVEGGLLALVFGALGALAGAAATVMLAQHGIALPSEALMWMNAGPRLFPRLEPLAVPVAIGALLLATAVASLIPAHRAAQLDPIEALRRSVR